MIIKITSSHKDTEAVSNLPHLDIAGQGSEEPDYRHLVIRKPWGYEYLAFQNQVVSVWVLSLNQHAKTSLHCHPNKKTSLIVLSGTVRCHTLNEVLDLTVGDVVLIGKGVFHSTEALTLDVLVMETETPISKKDLVRLDDAYGRKHQGYEGAEHHFKPALHEQDRFPVFHGSHAHNTQKTFGKCDVVVTPVATSQHFAEYTKAFSPAIVQVLQGTVTIAGTVFEHGDAFVLEDLNDKSNIGIVGEVELLFLSHH